MQLTEIFNDPQLEKQEQIDLLRVRFEQIIDQYENIIEKRTIVSMDAKIHKALKTYKPTDMTNFVDLHYYSNFDEGPWLLKSYPRFDELVKLARKERKLMTRLTRLKTKLQKLGAIINYEI